MSLLNSETFTITCGVCLCVSLCVKGNLYPPALILMSWLTLRWRLVQDAGVSKVFLPDWGEHDPWNTAPGQDCRPPLTTHTHPHIHTYTHMQKYLWTCSLGLLFISLAGWRSKQLVISFALFWPVSFGAVSLWDGWSLSLVVSAYWLSPCCSRLAQCGSMWRKKTGVPAAFSADENLSGLLVLILCCFQGSVAAIDYLTNSVP